MAQIISDYHELAKSLLDSVVDSIKKIKKIGVANDDIHELKRNLKVILNQEQRTSSQKRMQDTIMTY